MRPCANQVSGAFLGGVVSGADGESGENCVCFCRKRGDCFQLQTAAKISAFFSVSQIEIAHQVLKLLKIAPAYTIAIDRTEWQFGKQWVNVLMLAVSYLGVSILLFWMVTDEKGCSDNAERQTILQKFVDELGVESIKFVTADREFCSKDRMEFLIEKKIAYRLRNQGELSNHERAG